MEAALTTTLLVRPAAAHLPEYLAALRRGWSPDNLRPAVAGEQIEAIGRDPAGFLAGLEDRQARGGPITLPDGSTRPRLPSFRRWIWEAETDSFCGTIGARWQPGTTALPPHVLGHVGYAVVPWRRGRGHARRALALLLAELAPLGLPWVALTTEPGNDASIAVITANGGALVEEFAKPAGLGGGRALRFRIALSRPSSAR